MANNVFVVALMSWSKCTLYNFSNHLLYRFFVVVVRCGVFLFLGKFSQNTGIYNSTERNMHLEFNIYIHEKYFVDKYSFDDKCIAVQRQMM